MSFSPYAVTQFLRLLEDSHMRYIIPLKRGNRFVKGRVPASVSGYEELFSYRGRAIHSLTFRHDEEGWLQKVSLYRGFHC